MIRPHEIPRALAREALVRQASFRSQRAIARAARSRGPIVVGPWHSEIGFEVLYWIPLLRWLCETYGIGPERVIAISRGGAEPWYAGIAGTYHDLLDHRSVEQLRGLQEYRVREIGGQKQMEFMPAERQIVEEALGETRHDGAAILHPAAMYGLFRWFWSRMRPISVIEQHTVNRPLVAPDGPDIPLDGLPERYVAVKAYFSSCFPDRPENRAFIASLIAGLARTNDVVLLETGLEIDDHEDIVGEGSRITSARGLMSPRDNLEVQTRIIAGAEALVATYGGFAYLGPFLGVPSACFFSDENFNHEHLDVMSRAGRDLARLGAGAPFLPVRTADWRKLSPLAALLTERATA